MTNMLKSALFAATAFTSFVAVPALAADPAVLTVDVDQMFQNSAAGKSGSSQLSAKYNPVLQQRQTELNTAITAYNAQVNVLKAATKPGAQPQPTPAFLQARDRVQAAQDAVQEVEQGVNQLAGYVRSQIIDHARPVAEQIRAERRASAVIAKDSALAADPANDITSTLVQRLDASFTTPSITPPQPAQGAAAPRAVDELEAYAGSVKDAITTDNAVIGPLDIRRVMAALPHRYPMLLVDRVEEIVPNRSIRAIKAVTINEQFFQGHFPGRPIMPGVLIVEALAQAAGVLAVESFGLSGSGKLVYFMAIEGAKFRTPVEPGVLLTLEVDIVQLRGKICKFAGRASIEGKPAAEAQFTAMIADPPAA